MEEKKTIPVTPPVTAARRVFPVDGRDRALPVSYTHLTLPTT